jgi:SAM-dependent methyltransferase
LSARDFFDAIAPRYDRTFARPSAELREHVTRLLDALSAALGPGPHEILDLGVGTGLELPQLLDAGHSVVGVDLSPEMLALCNKRSRPIRTLEADFWKPLPLAGASFDAAIALFGTLAHAPSVSALDALARELVRVLRPRALFFAEIPTPEWSATTPTFRDEKSGAEVAITPLTPADFTHAFHDFAVTITERGAELEVSAIR